MIYSESFSFSSYWAESVHMVVVNGVYGLPPTRWISFQAWKVLHSFQWISSSFQCRLPLAMSSVLHSCPSLPPFSLTRRVYSRWYMSFQVSQSCATQSQHTYLYCWWIHHLAATHLVYHIQLRVQHINIIKGIYLSVVYFDAVVLLSVHTFIPLLRHWMLTMLFTPFAYMVILQAVTKHDVNPLQPIFSANQESTNG